MSDKPLKTLIFRRAAIKRKVTSAREIGTPSDEDIVVLKDLLTRYLNEISELDICINRFYEDWYAEEETEEVSKRYDLEIDTQTKHKFELN